MEIENTGRISIIYLIMPQDLISPKNQSWLSVYCGIQQTFQRRNPFRWRAHNPCILHHRDARSSATYIS